MAVLLKFYVECEEGKMVSAVCKYCPEIEHNTFMCEAWTRNLKGYALKSVENFRNQGTYIHQQINVGHVGTSSSLHNSGFSK